jgi:hypothetical protein
LAEGLESGIVDLAANTLSGFLAHVPSDEAAVVFYYSPLCPHSKKALPLFSEAAKQVSGCRATSEGARAREHERGSTSEGARAKEHE